MSPSDARGGVNQVCPKCFSENVKVVQIVDGNLFSSSGSSGGTHVREEIHCRNCHRVTKVQKGETAV
jgi:hypothetical protein